jgi:hypothetical protein
MPFKWFMHDPKKKIRQDSWPSSCMDPPTPAKKNKKDKIKAIGTVKKVKGDVIVEGSDKQKKNYTRAIVAGFFTPEVNICLMVSCKIWIPNMQEEGKVAGPFGKAGKCKVSFDSGISEWAAAGSKAKLHAAVP